MIVALVYAGVVLPASVLGRVALALALPVVVIVVWGRWLAPRAPRRLPPRAGLALKVALFAGTSVLLGLAAPVGVAVAFLVLTEAVIVAAERTP